MSWFICFSSRYHKLILTIYYMLSFIFEWNIEISPNKVKRVFMKDATFLTERIEEVGALCPSFTEDVDLHSKKNHLAFLRSYFKPNVSYWNDLYWKHTGSQLHVILLSCVSYICEGKRLILHTVATYMEFHKDESQDFLKLHP